MTVYAKQSELVLGIRPMRSESATAQMDRSHRLSGPLQWVREAAQNAFEADAKRVEFGIERQAQEKFGIARRFIADDGVGMCEAELVKFMGAYGGSGHQVGGAHSNYGVGLKTSCYPWNQEGVVVLSWQDGKGSMLRSARDPRAREHGLQSFGEVDSEGNPALCVEPFDEEGEVDWRLVKPSWIGAHGTVVVLCGDPKFPDSASGNPQHPSERALGAVRGAINSRFYEIPNEGEVWVDEFEAQGSEKIVRRQAVGFRSILEKSKFRGKKRIDQSGRLDLKVSEEKGSYPLAVDWYIWAKDETGTETPTSTHRGDGGRPVISVLYRGELYEQSSHVSRFKRFGIWGPAARRVTLVIEPPESDEKGRGSKAGVMPTTERSSLVWDSPARSKSMELPWSDWEDAFCKEMPVEISSLIEEQWEERPDEDELIRKTLEEFAEAMKASAGVDPTLRVDEEGEESVDPTLEGGRTGEGPGGEKGDGRGGGQGKTNGTEPGKKPARKVKTRKMPEPPQAIWVSPEEIWPQDFAEPNGLSKQQRKRLMSSKAVGEYVRGHRGKPGLLRLNKEFGQVVVDVAAISKEWGANTADKLVIREETQQVYKADLVCKIVHAGFLESAWSEGDAYERWLSAEGLTFAALGPFGKRALIETRVGGVLGKSRRKKPKSRKKAKS